MATQGTYYNPQPQAYYHSQAQVFANPQPVQFIPFDEGQAIGHVKNVIESLDEYQKPFDWGTVKAVVIDCLPAVLNLIASLANTGRPNVHINNPGINNTVSVNIDNNNNKKGKEDKNEISTAAGIAALGTAGGGMYAAGAAYRSYFGWSKKLNNATNYAEQLKQNAYGIACHPWAAKVNTINNLYMNVLNNIISDQRFKLAILAGIAAGGGIALFGYIFATKVAFTIGTAVGAAASLAGMWRLGTGDLNSDETNVNIEEIRRLAVDVRRTPSQPQPSAPPYVDPYNTYSTAPYQAQY